MSSRRWKTYAGLACPLGQLWSAHLQAQYPHVVGCPGPTFCLWWPGLVHLPAVFLGTPWLYLCCRNEFWQAVVPGGLADSGAHEAAQGAVSSLGAAPPVSAWDLHSYKLCFLEGGGQMPCLATPKQPHGRRPLSVSIITILLTHHFLFRLR